MIRPTWLESVARTARHAAAGVGLPDLTPPRSWSGAVGQAVRWGAAHTGLPVIVVAAVLLVVGFRMAKRAAHFVIELAFALTLLFFAAKLGWIRW